MRYDFSIPGAPTVVIALTGGRLEIESTEAGTGVSVEIDGDGVVAEQRRQAIAIRHARGMRPSPDVAVHLTLPATTALVVKATSATLLHTGTLRNARLHNAAGSLTVGTVTESLVARTGAGDITVDHVAGSAVLQTGAGRIDLGHASGVCRLASGFGDIEVGRSDTTLDLTSGSGMLTVHQAGGDLSARSGAGLVDVRLFEGTHLSARTHSGDITVALPEGRPVWRDIVTATGQVTTLVTPSGEPAKGAPHAEIRAVTRHGDITLRSAA